MTRDESILQSIREALLQDGRLSSHPIDVFVDAGRVTLRGAVQTFSRKRAALAIAGAIEGVVGITDEIDVTPPGMLSDQAVAENVRRALEARDDASKPAITVEVVNGVVTLRGTVAGQLQHLLTEDAVIAAAGVRGIHNLLFVSPDEQAEDIGRARDLQTVIGLTDGLRDAAVRVAVAGGAAVLSGGVSHVWQKQLAESLAQRMRFRAVRNEIEVLGTGAASPLDDA